MLGIMLLLIASLQSLGATEVTQQSQITVKDLTYGVRFDYSTYMASSIQGGVSFVKEAESLPLGGVVRIRQSFFLPSSPFELGVFGELTGFNSDGGFLILPALGVDLGWHFTFLRQDLLFTIGCRYGYVEYSEGYQGSELSVERIDRITSKALHFGLAWRF
ncbi:hypothetical protein [Sphaerochaeta pleomorpha]|uniref:hypothetical protein n=1 Tax=Sphaerochaeta pleomorpha TaxID=1131707 RepID=UPI001C06687C|nr:hypothetical protein [Sphaerochaeta pleomorpha]